jgi:hypothetical protein
VDEQTRTLARWLIRQAAAAHAQAAQYRTMPRMLASVEGQRHGYRLALAYIAGQHGYAGPEDLADALTDPLRLGPAITESELRLLDGNR